ncbi:putative DNA modification/repair radical SAM protein [Candidatus Woesearchaeota archaeon]|jgi:putative DNA modification/repair radical SAM protein|nr:putative DNA modification/repair radical SAM protein [Candidatus Woesearchaeota archaeon]
MEIGEKIKILGDAGKWDTCASTSSNRTTNTDDRIGNVAKGGICHSFTEDGRCVALFKTLMTNQCKFDCKYCQNANNCTKNATMYKPDELAKVFMHLYTRNYVEGLFLSSGVCKDANYTTEKMLEAIQLIRTKYKFQGYIHFKVLPGTSRFLVNESSKIADRLSINLEAPNTSRMANISSIKDFKTDIIRRQSWIKHSIKNNKQTSGQTTQLVIGSSDETDLEILKTIDWEYKNMDLKRAYYSAFVPVHGTDLEFKDKTPYVRENRLYNVDFMMRQYDIKLNEFKEVMNNDNLPKGDPKIHLARNYFDGPIDVNEASKEELLRIPGIGPTCTQRIMSMQDKGAKIQKKSQLKSIGVVLKRAEPFLRINGISQRTLAAFAV